MINNNNDKAPRLPAIAAGFKPTFYYAGFAEYRRRLGFTRSDVAALVDKSAATVRRWDDQDTAPRWLYLLLYCCAGYLLDADFYGFQVIDGMLWTGTRITRNRGFTRAELTEYGFFREYTRTLERELRRPDQAAAPRPCDVSNVLPFIRRG